MCTWIISGEHLASHTNINCGLIEIMDCWHLRLSSGREHSHNLSSPVIMITSRAGVLNQGEISSMGEILGIRGGNESV